jgi:hypothetical protein
MRAHARAISFASIAVIVVAGALQLFDPFGDESPWLSLGALYFSAAALGLDAMACGVRKRTGVGPSIANLAPGGWTIFASMFWIIAVPAYFIGVRRRRRAVGATDDEPREPIGWGSWVTIATFALLGVALCCAPLVR